MVRTMPFRDHFSQQAKEYARHRPVYPGAMFGYLASLAPGNELAWDCGTGNGQAALALIEYFQRVIATDASASQIENAFPHERIEYRVEPSEKTTTPSSAVDLITVGTAVHWFDFETFFQEVRRVGAPKAVIAVWTYHFPITEPAIARWIEDFYWVTLKGLWPGRIRYLEEHYKTLPFPFEEIPAPAFEIETAWSPDDLIGFVASWSAVRKLIEVRGETEFKAQVRELESAWGQKREQKNFRWPLHMRIGRVS